MLRTKRTRRQWLQLAEDITGLELDTCLRRHVGCVCEGVEGLPLGRGDARAAELGIGGSRARVERIVRMGGFSCADVKLLIGLRGESR